MTLYINEDSASLASALVVGVGNTTPAGTPELVLSDVVPFKLVVVDAAAAVVDLTATHTISLAIGTPGASPSSGTYTITSGHTTSALAYDITAANLETAFNALEEVNTDGGLDVTGEFPDYLLSWRTVGAKTAITSDPSLLYPQSSVLLTTLTAGDGTHKQVVLMRLRQDPIVTQASWSNDTGPAGYIANVSMATLPLYQFMGADESKEATIEIKLTKTADSTTTRILQAKINLLNSLE